MTQKPTNTIAHITLTNPETKDAISFATDEIELEWQNEYEMKLTVKGKGDKAPTISIKFNKM